MNNKQKVSEHTNTNIITKGRGPYLTFYPQEMTAQAWEGGGNDYRYVAVEKRGKNKERKKCIERKRGKKYNLKKNLSSIFYDLQ